MEVIKDIIDENRVKVEKSPIGGDCTICWEPLELETNLTTGSQSFVCSNRSICGEKYKS